MEKMLIADDNRQITAVLTAYARKEGFESVVAYDGEEALAAYRREAPAVILLDVMMPKLDGFEVCRRIREESAVPIIMITARGEDFEKIMRRLSRDGGARHQFFSYKGLTIDLDTYTTTVDGEAVPLTKKETELLWTLATNRQKVFSRDNLLDAVWGYDYYGDNRTVDSHIRRLRAKLGKREHPGWSVATIWGVGYRFEVNDEEA